MTIKSFITSKLAEFVSDHPQIKVAYQNDANTCSHIIDVQPNWVQNLKWFKAFEEDLVFNSIDKFPYENIHFISDQSYTKISKPDAEYVGKTYHETGNIRACAEAELYSLPSDFELTTVAHNRVNERIETISYAFDYSTFDYSALVSTDPDQLGLTGKAAVLASLNLVLSSKVSFDVTTFYNKKTSGLKDAGESNYAMAA